MAATEREPHARSMHAHLLWLTSPVRETHPNARVEIAWSDPGFGPDRARTFGIGELPNAVGFADWINRKRCNVYVGLTPKSTSTPLKGRTNTEHSMIATALLFDIDADFAATAERVAALAKPQFMVVTGRQPETRCQLLVRLAPTTDLGEWDLLQSRAVAMCGSDENATGPNRLMRLGGTISYPSPAKAARGYIVEQTSVLFIPAQEYRVAELMAAMPPAPPLSPAPINFPVQPALTATRPKPPLAVVATSLRNLPLEYASDRTLWIKVGFALYDFDSGPTGFGLWLRFSQRCPDKAKETNFAKVWQSFGRHYEGHRITVKWLVREARKPVIGATPT